MPASTGYKEEFEELFKSNYSKLYYYALNIISDSEEARDIVSDAFRYVWEHFDEMDGMASAKGLLYTLVRNKCIDNIRHRNVYKNYEKSVMDDTFSWIENEYEEKDERMEKVMKSIDRLSPQTKAVFNKCFIEGKKYKEVGEELGISANTVKTHIVKALKIIREESKKEE